MISKLKIYAKIILATISPKLQANIRYKYVTGQWIDWKNPQDFNAKINYLKLNDYYKNPVITKCVDKYRIREYLAEKNLLELTPKLYGVYDKPEDIEWDSFPEKFVVKCNHACGTNIIVKDKSKLDVNAATKQLKKWMKIDLWREGELQYKFIEKKIIVEEYLENGEEFETYKFYCFNGEPKVLYVSTNDDYYLSYFDMDYNRLPIKKHGCEPIKGHDEKPLHWDDMLRVSRLLSKDFPFVRVDLYDTPEKIYISELTFIPTGGNMRLDSQDRLNEWGSWIQLKEENK